MVLGLVQPRLLLGLAAEESEGPGRGRLPSDARRNVFHGTVRAAVLRAVGCLAFVSSPSHGGVPGSEGAINGLTPGLDAGSGRTRVSCELPCISQSGSSEWLFTCL